MSVMKINTTPIVSVVMPIFKHSPAQLIRAINSILSQTLTDFEFIIIDGNPNGNNKKIIRRFADKIFTKHHFSKQEALEFLAFSKISQKALPNLNTTKLLAPYFHYIASHCGFNIYASFAYCQTYFTYDVKQAIKKLAKFMFTVKNERFGDKKYKVLQIFGIRIKLKAKK